ncbi:hypothetical protein [Nonomuraea sp. NPDC001831]|uniref:hypothetical protein n=1 Tax=Nonomuraea sp. NPDC001831 TaxID=3364340 RepID=UPI0036BC65BD
MTLSANEVASDGIQLFMIGVTLSLLLALSPAAVTEIPKNFLFTERQARVPLSPDDAAEQGYKISDRLTAPLRAEPVRAPACRRPGPHCRPHDHLLEQRAQQLGRAARPLQEPAGRPCRARRPARRGRAVRAQG